MERRRILRRFYRQQDAEEDRRKVARILMETGGEETPPPTLSTVTLPGDKRRLRGIPVAGGACGTSPDTDPVAALLRKEEQVR